MGVWNAWRHREVGGFISAGVRSVGTSDAVTVLRASTHRSMRPGQGTIITSFEPGEDWFYDYETQGMVKGVELLPPIASGGSTITWTGRESSSQLGIATALAVVGRILMNGSGTWDPIALTVRSAMAPRLLWNGQMTILSNIPVPAAHASASGAVLLAGGDGLRLRDLTARIAGDDRPDSSARLSVRRASCARPRSSRSALFG